jgi:hypothetical protein
MAGTVENGNTEEVTALVSFQYFLFSSLLMPFLKWIISVDRQAIMPRAA